MPQRILDTAAARLLSADRRSRGVAKLQAVEDFPPYKGSQQCQREVSHAQQGICRSTHCSMVSGRPPASLALRHCLRWFGHRPGGESLATVQPLTRQSGSTVHGPQWHSAASSAATRRDARRTSRESWPPADTLGRHA